MCCLVSLLIFSMRAVVGSDSIVLLSALSLDSQNFKNASLSSKTCDLI